MHFIPTTETTEKIGIKFYSNQSMHSTGPSLPCLNAINTILTPDKGDQTLYIFYIVS